MVLFGQLYFRIPHAGQLRYHDFHQLEESRKIRQEQRKQQLIGIGITRETIRMFTTLQNEGVRQYKTLMGGCNHNHNNNNSSKHEYGVVGGSRRSFWNRSGGGNHNNGSSRPSFVTNIQLKSLERTANSSPEDPFLQYAFVSELVKYYPQVVVQRLTHKSFQNMAIHGPTALLLLQTIQYTGDYRSLDVVQLIHRLERTYQQNAATLQDTGAAGAGGAVSHDGGAVVAEGIDKNSLLELKTRFKNLKLTKQQQAQQLMHFLSTGIVPPLDAMDAAALSSLSRGSVTSAAATAGLGATAAMNPHAPSWNAAAVAAAPPGPGAALRGADPKYPLHVQMHQPMSTRAALLGLGGRLFLAFVVVSALGAMLDDKGVGRAMGMNNSSKHIQEADQQVNVSFSDVKGVEEAKAELEEIVMYLKDPSKFTRLGGKLPRGLLLTGPPGTGKTLLAKAIAGEAHVPFFFSSGSQFEEVYVGLGAKRVRELFETAKKKSPAIIFIDEIDAIGGTRRLKDQSALKMTLNELLVQLDGFDENNGIIVIGATNFMESLDPALLRPGRFDKHVTVPLPDVGGRREILEMYANKTKLAKDVDLTILARGTTGFSGADLHNLMNQAALKASVDGLNAITMSVLEYAKDKIMMGAERRTAVVTPETAKCTAYHEAGHALVAILTEGAQPIHKATIMPRGSALGMVTLLPEGDQLSQSLKQMLAFIDVAMGGRVAEELIFGKEEVTSGAMSDIANATRIARNMVTKYGFSDQVGLVYHGGDSGEESASDETRAQIDAEVKQLTDASYQRVKALLTKYKEQHHLLAQTLIEYETLTGDEVRDLILKGTKPKRPVINQDGGRRGDPELMKKSSTSSSSTNRKVKGAGVPAASAARNNHNNNPIPRIK